PVGVADAHGERLLALERLAVRVFSIPGEGGLLIGRGREALLEQPAGDADFQLDPPQARGDARAAERNVHRLAVLATRRAVALIVQREPRACDPERFAQRLVLAADDRAGALAVV